MYDKYIDKSVYVNLPQGNIKGILSKVTKKYLVLLVVDASTEELFEYIISKKKVNYIAYCVKNSSKPQKTNT